MHRDKIRLNKSKNRRSRRRIEDDIEREIEVSRREIEYS